MREAEDEQMETWKDCQARLFSGLEVLPSIGPVSEAALRPSKIIQCM